MELVENTRGPEDSGLYGSSAMLSISCRAFDSGGAPFLTSLSLQNYFYKSPFDCKNHHIWWHSKTSLVSAGQRLIGLGLGKNTPERRITVGDLAIG
jgi:hypothetical protein